MTRCKDCEYCKLLYRADVIHAGIGRSYGRGEFFCENPKTINLPAEAFGNKMRGFIGFGTPEKDTKLHMKTSPRWCPKKGRMKISHEEN